MSVSKTIRAAAKTLRDRSPVGAALIRLVRGAKSLGVPVPKRVYRHLPYRGVVRVPAGDAAFRIHSYGHYLENHLYWEGLGGQDGVCLRAWTKLVAAGEGAVLDIGANTGLFALAAAAARPGVKVVAFEPLARVAELARRNVALNDRFDIEVRQLAVSDSEGTATIHDPGGDQPASASLLADFLDAPTQGVEVPVVTVDALCIGAGDGEPLGRVDVAKIDVEGIEDRVLAGMRQTILRDRPAMFIEVLAERAEVTEQLAFLEGEGYRSFDLAETGAAEMTGAFRVPRDRNLLCVPEERVSQLVGIAGFQTAPTAAKAAS